MPGIDLLFPHLYCGPAARIKDGKKTRAEKKARLVLQGDGTFDILPA
jgi:hypothetical protein